MTPCLSLLCFMIFGPPGLVTGATVPAVSSVPGSAIQAYGQQSRCLAWTDGCVLCTAGSSGQPRCSTPGIACTPRAITCGEALKP